MLKISLACVLLCPFSTAQDPSSVWKLPPRVVIEIVDAPLPPDVIPSPDAGFLLLVDRPALPPLSDVSRPWVGLAGIRIDPDTNGRHQVQFNTGLALRALTDARTLQVELPADARIGDLRWSHDGRRFAFTLVGRASIDLWVAEAGAQGKTLPAKPIATGLNAVLGTPFEWMPDAQRLIVRLKPRARAAAPDKARVPAGPAVQETAGERTPIRTYQDLLGDAHDVELFDHYVRAQLALVDARTGETRLLGAEGAYTRAEPSPDGRYLLVERLRRPYSYLLTWSSFPQTVELWDESGRRVQLLAELPLAENVPIEGVRTGPRNHSWQANAPSTVVWTEALDGGDPKRKVEARDQWYALAAPFAAGPKPLVRCQHRARGLSWLAQPDQVIVSEYDRDRRWLRSQLMELGDEPKVLRVLDDRSVNDQYGDPGRVLTRTDTLGQRIVRQDGEWIYRSGSGDTPEGSLPFLDRQSLASGETQRLWRCARGGFESPVQIVESSAGRKPRVLTSRESAVLPPNFWLCDLEAGTDQALTSFLDPTPQLRAATKQLLTYARADGVALSGTLYLPAGHAPGTRLPLLVWAYPLEYNDAATAGQVRSSPDRFTRYGGISHLLMLTQGYAVLDNATMPVVGDPETANDTFLTQMVASAQAAIDKVVELGLGDHERVAVGGHSYGAFMTANLLAHCDLFKAGIARSGAYNRSLTPFGFQSERRTLWEAPAIYAALSPFFHADRINEPLLLIHGEKDSNPGTFPLQSERLYQAIKGHGGKTRLVILPHEDHGYRSREAALHVQAETIEWLDRYVKSPAGEAARATAIPAGAPAR